MGQDSSPAEAPIVVGVDGSDHSMAAAEFAADEAAVRGRPLEIVHAYISPAMPRPTVAPPDLPPIAPMAQEDEPEQRERADQMLHETAEKVRSRHRDLPVVTRRHDGYPSEVLIAASHHASAVALGHRGIGGFGALLVGSVAVQVANHATCPVFVVRGERHPDAPVLVGVDGSEGSRRAAEFAADTAEQYGAPLVVLFAGPQDPGWAPERAQAGYEPPGVPTVVEQLVAELTVRRPGLTIEPQIRHAQPGHEALVAASQQARLAVVGSRGLGGFRGLLLGSVSHALVHHAECPVAVIGPHAAEDPFARRDPDAGQP